MRPVDKGKAPDVIFKKYQDAEPYLEERIGPYCSFCEFYIQHVPEVEHKESKSQGGEELEWGNLLLSCKYCNTRKGISVKGGDLKKYLWPDEDNTFYAFTYSEAIPKLNEEYLKEQDESVREKAENLYNLLKLGNIPTNPSDRDRRFAARNEAKNCAVNSRNAWENMQHPTDKEAYLAQTIILAKATGFFSVWMDVFKDYPEATEKLIDAFKGTKKEYIKNKV